MKQRYEIPLPLDEVKERLRADMQTDWPLGKLLRSVKGRRMTDAVYTGRSRVSASGRL